MISTNVYVICNEFNEGKVYDVDSSPFVLKNTFVKWSYGFIAGGLISPAGPYQDIIEYIDITITSGNAVDSGDLTVARSVLAGVSSSNYGFWCGGMSHPAVAQDIIEWIDITVTSSNGSDRGNLSTTMIGPGGVNGTVYGFIGGKYSAGNAIDYIELTTATANGLDKGDLSVGRHTLSSCAGGPTYGFFCGGSTGPISYSNIIDYIDITTTIDNATDSGDLTQARSELGGGVHSTLYGFIGGGRSGAPTYDIIDYIDVTTTGNNALDKGDLTLSRGGVAGTSGANVIYGFFCGGITQGNSNSNVIDYIELVTTAANAIDRGNLIAARPSVAGVTQ